MDRTVTFKQEEASGHEPQPGLDTKTDRQTDRQSQCDFDFEIRGRVCVASSSIVVVLSVFRQQPSILQVRLCIQCNYNKYLYISLISGCLYIRHPTFLLTWASEL
jgi:hypothetical protein